MNEKKRLQPEQIEELAIEIRSFLMEHRMWLDTTIYFNGKSITSVTLDDGSRDDYFCRENVDPRDEFEYVNEDHILSMSFEGPVCHMLNYGTDIGLNREFDKIFEKYGLGYELGNIWNLTCYYDE